MIEVKVPAFMSCDTDGCQKSMDVRLCLLGTGGFAFKPKGDAREWQIAMGQNATFITTCPEHRRTIETLEQPKMAIVKASH